MSDLTLDALGSVQNRLADAPELRATVTVDDAGRQIYTALAYDITEPDRHGTTMTAGSLDADLDRGIPLMLWHDRESFPVGKVIGWEHTEKGPVARFIFAEYDKAHLARALVDSGFLTAVSVGFIPKEGYLREADDTVVFTRAELVELSLTATPSSRGALIDLKRSIDDLTGPAEGLPVETTDDVEGDTVEAVELAAELEVEVEDVPDDAERAAADRRAQRTKRTRNLTS
jgi:HK97 family phage prohead protease